jgi:hypothetical protein
MESKAVIELTTPGNTKVHIDGKRVVRARATLPKEEITNTARTRIEWVTMSFVTEPLETVVPLILAELPSFTSLTTRDGSKQWFDAKKAIGPLPLGSDNIDKVVKSAIQIGSQKIFVIETPAEVRSVLEAAGGDPLPIPGSFIAFVTSALNSVRRVLGFGSSTA